MWSRHFSPSTTFTDFFGAKICAFSMEKSFGRQQRKQSRLNCKQLHSSQSSNAPCAVYAERCAPCNARRIKKNVALHVFQTLSIRSAFVEMAKYWFAHGRRANVPTFNPIFICIIDYFKLILSRNSHHLFHFNTLFKVNTVWEWIEWNITCISNKHLNLFWIRSEVILDRVWNKFWFSSRCSIRFHLSVFEFFTPFRRFAFSVAQREFHSKIKRLFLTKFLFLKTKLMISYILLIFMKFWCFWSICSIFSSTRQL